MTIRSGFVEDPHFGGEVDSTALQASLENLADAWDRFFRKQCKKPNFKSKKNPVQSYTSKHTNGNIRVGDSWVRLPKLGCVRAVVSRKLAGQRYTRNKFLV